jgi:hypothetical protein
MADEEIKSEQVETSVESDVNAEEVDVSKIDPSVSTEAEKKAIETLKRSKESETEITDGPSEGILSKIKSLMTGKEEPVSKEETDIPDDFTQAAQAAGWSDEDIVEFASQLNDDGEFVYSDEDLKEMISFLYDEEEVVEDKVETKVEDKKEEKKDEKENPELAALKAEIDSLKEALKDVNQSKEENKISSMGDFAEEFLDEMSEDFPIFGKGKELPKFPDGRLIPSSPQYKARAEVLGYALKLHSGGSDWDDALVNAFNLYKGKNLEKDIERSVIKRLKADAEKLSPDRYNKVTEKTYQDETEREADVVRKAMEATGIKSDK